MESLYEPILLRQQADIRLVALQPSSDPRSLIRCRLIPVSLDQDLKFEALSYVWGQPGGQKEIVVNKRSLSIRYNLWTALQYLRESECERMLWIDAICIDQSNVAERNHQVQQMCRIYRKSWRVLIWLGSESHDSKLALDFITFVGQTTRKNDTRRTVHTGVDREVQAIYNICKRPYWDRLWIVQEVVLARVARLQCGRDYASWDDFDRFQNTLEKRRIQVTSKDITRNLLKAKAFNLGRYQISRPNIGDLLQAFSSSFCSEPKDKIYGLAGLAADVQNLRIDYAKSFFNIFEDVIATQQGGDLALVIAFGQFLQRLLEHNVIPPTPKDLQSSTKLIGALGYCTGSILKIVPFRPGLSLSERLYHELPVEGISQMSQSYLDDAAFVMHHESVARCVLPIRSTNSYACLGGQESKVVDQSDFRSESRWAAEDDRNDLDSNELEPNTFENSIQRIQALNDRLIIGRTQRILASVPTTQKHEINVRDLDLEDSHPCFFIDGENRIGLAPSTAREWDLLCRFRDCDIAALVRLHDDRYLIVGRALLLKRGDEREIRTHQGSSENFTFSVPSDDELDQTMSFWLSTHTLQQLTQ